MNRGTRRLAAVSLVSLSLIVLLGACQRERPAAAPEEGWTVTPAGQPSATPATTVLPGPATTVIAVGTAVPGTSATPAFLTVGTALPTLLAPAPAVTPTAVTIVVPVGPTASYTVQAGDTLFGLALQYDIDVATLRQLNNLADDSLQIGQVLVVPGKVPTVQEPGQGVGASSGGQAVPGSQFSYVVQTGDTLSSIATQFGVTWQEIAAANSILAPTYTIYRGQKLVIPGVTTPAGTNVQGTKHAVQAGETLFSIATQYGTTVQAIMEANQLSDPNLIQVGQELLIPQ